MPVALANIYLNVLMPDGLFGCMPDKVKKHAHCK